MAEYNPSKIIKDGNTYNFRDNTKIPLAGTDALSGSIVPDTDNSVDLGSSSKNIKMIHTKGITINGTQFLPSDYATLSGLSTVATSGSYNDLSNKPTIPTVNNATLTIQCNGTTVDTFTANSSTDKTVNIAIPTKTSDLTNDNNFVPSTDLATVATSGSYNDLSDKPATITPTSHTHGNITNDGKIGSNANKPLITTTNGTVTTGSFGTTANTFCEGNDSRLSDARTPTAHTHSASDITSGLATVATSGSYNDLSNKPTVPVIDSALSSTSENGLQNKVIKSALDGKANSTHTHTKSDITDFPTLATVATTGSYNDLTDKPTIPPSVEFASEQEVTDTVLSEMNYLL